MEEMECSMPREKMMALGVDSLTDVELLALFYVPVREGKMS